MDIAIWIWLAALIVFIIVEIATINLTTIWFAGGAIAGMVLSGFHTPWWAQLTGFIVVSLLLLIFARPYIVKAIDKNKFKSNVEGLIGEKAKVTETIDNINNTGTALVKGLEWTARAEDEKCVIKEGEVVEIVAVSGVKLIVK